MKDCMKTDCAVCEVCDDCYCYCACDPVDRMATLYIRYQRRYGKKALERGVPGVTLIGAPRVDPGAKSGVWCSPRVKISADPPRPEEDEDGFSWTPPETPRGRVVSL